MNSTINSGEKSLVPSTAKTHGVNFDLGNITTGNIGVAVDLNKSREEFKSTLPSLKKTEHNRKVQNYTNESIDERYVNKKYNF